MTKEQYKKQDAAYIAEKSKHWERVRHHYKSKSDKPIPPGMDEAIFGARIRAYNASVEQGDDPEIARHRWGLADDFEKAADIPTVEQYIAASKWLDS